MKIIKTILCFFTFFSFSNLYSRTYSPIEKTELLNNAKYLFRSEQIYEAFKILDKFLVEVCEDNGDFYYYLDARIGRFCCAKELNYPAIVENDHKIILFLGNYPEFLDNLLTRTNDCFWQYIQHYL